MADLQHVPQDYDVAQIEDCALAEFFHHYTIKSEDPSVSRGYLAGIEARVRAADPSDGISQAAKVVALASLGSRLKWATLLEKARSLYVEALTSLSTDLSNGALTDISEPLATAVLLGLYEFITANLENPSNHNTHSRGVTAMLCTINDSPRLSLGGCGFRPVQELWTKQPAGSNVFQAVFPHAQASLDKVRPPSGTDTSFVVSLDGQVQNPEFHHVDLHELLRQGKACLSPSITHSDDLRRLLHNATLLDEDLSRWPAQLPDICRPQASKSVRELSKQYPQWWPDCSDNYFDLYVAASWNTYRKNRLLILDIIIQCLEKLQEKDAHGRRQAEAKELANDIKASIPFHLDRDYENTTARCHGLKDDIQPGRCLGGLLLMHPLFVASNLSVIPSHMRSQLKECLAWIGEHMGIGQASVFAKTTTTFPNESIVHGYVLLCAGMLVHPR